MFGYWLRHPLMDPEPGSGGGNGTPPPLTAADVQKMITTALATHSTAVKTQIETATKPLTDGLTSVLDAIKGLTPPPPPDPKAGGDPALNTKVQQLEQQNKTLADTVNQFKTQVEQERSRREETERQAAIRQKLAGFKFANTQSAELAFDFFDRRVKRGEDGSLVVDTPAGQVLAEAFITEQVNGMTNLLAPEDKGGSGARPGGPPSNRAVDLNAIRPGMKPEEKAAALAAMREAYGLSK